MKEIALTGFILTLLFVLLNFTKKQKETKEYLLISYMILVGAEFMFLYLRLNGTEIKWPALFDTFWWASFGPLTLLYIHAATRTHFRFRPKHAFHLLPLVLGLLAVKDYFLTDVAYGYEDYFAQVEGIWKAAYVGWLWLTPAYILYCVFILVHYKITIRYYVSSVSGRALNWLTVLVAGYVTILCISNGIWITERLFNIEIHFRTHGYLPAILTVYIIVMGIFGYRQKNMLSGLAEGAYSWSLTERKKRTKPELSEEERKSLFEKLEALMNEKKPFLQPDLTVFNLAEMLGTDAHSISRVIKETLNQNFYRFIHTCRSEKS
jgi:hypothetical protein